MPPTDHADFRQVVGLRAVGDQLDGHAAPGRILEGRGNRRRRHEVGVGDQDLRVRTLDELHVGLLDVGLLEPGPVLEEAAMRRAEFQFRRPRLQHGDIADQFRVRGVMHRNLAGRVEQLAGRVPVQVGVEDALRLLDADEVIEVSIEGRHQVGDDPAAQHHILVAPVGIGLPRVDAEVLVADIQPPRHGNRVVRFPVDDPHLLVDPLVRVVQLGVGNDPGDGHLVEPLQRHRFIALDLDAVLLEVEEQPLRLQPGVRERVDDDAHVESLVLLLLQHLRDPQSRLVTLEDQGLDADRRGGPLESLHPHRKGILPSVQDSDAALRLAAHREQPRQPDVLEGTPQEAGVVAKHRGGPGLGDERLDRLVRLDIGITRPRGAAGQQARDAADDHHQSPARGAGNARRRRKARFKVGQSVSPSRQGWGFARK